MNGFDITLIVDWSGGNDTGPRPRKDAIWVGEIGPDMSTAQTRYFRNRRQVEEWLGDRFQTALAADQRVFAGFDFPFGYPRGFGKALTDSDDPLAVWDWLEARLDDIPEHNNRFELAGEINRRFPGVGPFWFHPPKRTVAGLPLKGSARRDHGLPERRAIEETTKGTFSCWQLGGAGAVGSQVITGLPVLNRLRRRFGRQLSVWPFQRQDRPIHLVEIWPSLISGAVNAQRTPDAIKDEVQVRLLAEAIHAQPASRMAHWLAEGDPLEGGIFAASDRGALLYGLSEEAL